MARGSSLKKPKKKKAEEKELALVPAKKEDIRTRFNALMDYVIKHGPTSSLSIDDKKLISELEEIGKGKGMKAAKPQIKGLKGYKVTDKAIAAAVSLGSEIEMSAYGKQKLSFKKWVEGG